MLHPMAKAPEMSEGLTTRDRALGKADFGTSASPRQLAPRIAQLNSHLVAITLPGPLMSSYQDEVRLIGGEHKH